jgi:hypothetical protein
MNTINSLANTFVSDLYNPSAHCLIISSDGFIVPYRASNITASQARRIDHYIDPQEVAKPSCNISLSRLKSATSFFSRVFSFSNCYSRRSPVTVIPPYYFFQLQNVTSETPSFLVTFEIGVPVFAFLSPKAICCSVNLVFFMYNLLA